MQFVSWAAYVHVISIDRRLQLTFYNIVRKLCPGVLEETTINLSVMRKYRDWLILAVWYNLEWTECTEIVV